jgi:hypothetical protein
MHEAERHSVFISSRVRCRQTLQRLADEVDGDPERQPALLARLGEHFRERLTVHPLHRQVEHAILLAELEGLHDVRVMNLGS